VAVTDKAHLFGYYWRALADLTHGLPEPVAEYPPRGTGAPPPIVPGRRFRSDWAWPALQVTVEVEGGRWKAGGGRHNTDADYEKYNLYQLEGWQVYRVSTHELERSPQRFISIVCEALRRRMNERG
jgi:hypothetical protein